MLSYLRVCGDSGEPNVEQTVWEINALQHKKNKQAEVFKHAEQENHEIKQNDA